MFIELPDSVIRLVAEFGSAAPAKIRRVMEGYDGAEALDRIERILTERDQ